MDLNMYAVIVGTAIASVGGWLAAEDKHFLGGALIASGIAVSVGF